MNPIARTLGMALGKLFRNLKNPRWYAAEAGKAGVRLAVIGPAGAYVYAKLHGHFHHDDGHIGDHYKDDHGNEYIVVNNKKYRHDPRDDNFYLAHEE